jgi:hypothetical protein
MQPVGQEKQARTFRRMLGTPDSGFISRARFSLSQ